MVLIFLIHLIGFYFEHIFSGTFEEPPSPTWESRVALCVGAALQVLLHPFGTLCQDVVELGSLMLTSYVSVPVLRKWGQPELHSPWALSLQQ